MAATGPNLIEVGIYTVGEAAFLVGVSERRVRGWLAGYKDRSTGPIIHNELGWMDERLALSFRNLMEMRFIAYFEQAGVKYHRIRKIMDEVRQVTTHPHPFSTNIVFRTDGVRIVGEIINRLSGVTIYDLASKNFEIVPLLYKELKDNVKYDFNGDAVYWIPRPDTAPNVIVHPKFAFGKPIIRASGIPTRALADAVESEGSAATVADMFERPLGEVREAVRFEAELRKAA
jgi:uncharacterized protein (DUF433 family)